MKEKTFAKRLINWYTDRKRDLPWRENTEPYPVWLSEIILQQTRVAQGLPYWERFMSEFPKISDLARAPEAKVLRLWEGLGYYSRARNLHAAAKYIDQELNGVFPSTYSEIIQLKGVGPYTAAAIASICFKEPAPVVDGNVFRFASRYFGIEEDISKARTRKIFENHLKAEISEDNPGDFNQAMMEFGATICSPSPNCTSCIFAGSCFAFAASKQDQLPIKSGKTKVRKRELHYLVFQSQDQLLMKRREGKDVWEGLYDFYLIEGTHEEVDILNQVNQLLNSQSFVLQDISNEVRHILSHQHLYVRFYEIHISPTEVVSLLQNTPLRMFSTEEVLTLPKPKLIVNFLKELKGQNK